MIQRKSNIEVLRIFSMILILMHHYSVHGGFIFNPNVLSLNKILVQFLSAGGKLGVDCFILITGFFMIESNFKLQKLLKLLFQIFFYSFGFLIIFVSLGQVNLNIKIIIKSIFPVMFNSYWFATNYVILYILSPFINQFIKKIGKEYHLNLILVLVFIWSFIPTFTTARPAFSPLVWFVTLYIIAAYIRLYPVSWFEKSKVNIIIGSVTYALILLSIVVFDIIGTKLHAFARYATYFTSMTSLLVLVSAVSLFLGFKNISIKYNAVINRIAASMFGIYLIHDNFLVRPFLWNNLFKNSSYYNSPYLFFHAFVVISSVFIVSLIIDQIRLISIERMFVHLIEKQWDMISLILKKLKSKLIVFIDYK